RDQPDEDEDRRERAERDEHERLGHGGGQLDPGLSERLEDERREPDEEDELAERARVPAGDREREPVGGLAAVPAREGGDREHEPGDPREPLAPVAGHGRARPRGALDRVADAGREEGLGRLHGQQYGENRPCGVREPPPRQQGVTWQKGSASSRSSPPGTS